MVLLVLAIVWGVLLISWLRSRSEGTFSDSVGTFKRHLTVLEKAAPYTVAPANRLRSSGATVARNSSQYRSPVTIRGQRIDAPGRTAPARGSRPIDLVRRVPSAAAHRRRQSQKRRRDVFFALLAGVVGSFLVAIIPGLSVMWPVQGLFDVLFVGYLALLVHLRNAAAERELKVRFMPSQARTARVNPSYDFGAAGYGDLELRRAVN